MKTTGMNPAARWGGCFSFYSLDGCRLLFEEDEGVVEFVGLAGLSGEGWGEQGGEFVDRLAEGCGEVRGMQAGGEVLAEFFDLSRTDGVQHALIGQDDGSVFEQRQVNQHARGAGGVMNALIEEDGASPLPDFRPHFDTGREERTDRVDAAGKPGPQHKPDDGGEQVGDERSDGW